MTEMNDVNEIKNCIDTGLRKMTLPPDFATRITDPRNHAVPVHGLRRAAAAVLCIALLGTTAFAAGSLLHSRISVNQQTIPDLAPMEVIPLQPVDGTITEYGQLTKTYTSMETLAHELGIRLLGANLAADNPYIKISYTKTGDGYNEIDVERYLLGDLADIREWDGAYTASAAEGNDRSYVWTHGNLYKSPINLGIRIISNPSQPELDIEYMGFYQYIETFTSGQGYTVNVLQETSHEDHPDSLPDGFVPRTVMVFVADGIQYTLQGHVPVQTMREVVSAMTY
ncbi:MAG: hypothetical protein K2P40_12200 [Lachnospiraceae bacterium]|nr:hypothetical protein [Lachnospiraceae bacterium]MDE6941688.1 hypothetical protein [Lachnospiraceae bacterium]